jgi:hypothetical protein
MPSELSFDFAPGLTGGGHSDDAAPSAVPSDSAPPEAAPPEGGAQDVPAGQPEAPAPADPQPIDTRPRLTNYVEVPVGNKIVRRGRPTVDIAHDLLAMTGVWPRRVGSRLFVHEAGLRPDFLDTVNQLFAWMRLGIRVSWATGPDCTSRSEFLEALRLACRQYDEVVPFPHFPPVPNVYYHHDPLPPADGTAMSGLLSRFAPASPLDAYLLRAFVLTLFWGGPAGQRPGWLFTGPENDPLGGVGVGKSTIVALLSDLVGGYIDVSPRDDMTEVKKRLLSPAAADKRLVRIDNIKEPRLDWADLDGLLTSDVVSGRQMFKGEGRRPNNLVWALTMNGASLSRDLARRCVVVRLQRAPNTPTWLPDTKQFIADHRWQIIADIGQALDAPASWSPPPGGFRWGAWAGQVLARVEHPQECLALIQQRQEAVDDDASEADLVACEFRDQLQQHGHDVTKDCVFITSGTAADWLKRATKTHWPTNKATSHLKSLAIAEMTTTRKDGKPGWRWRGPQAAPNATMCRLGG